MVGTKFYHSLWIDLNIKTTTSVSRNHGELCFKDGATFIITKQWAWRVVKRKICIQPRVKLHEAVRLIKKRLYTSSDFVLTIILQSRLHYFHFVGECLNSGRLIQWHMLVPSQQGGHWKQNIFIRWCGKKDHMPAGPQVSRLLSQGGKLAKGAFVSHVARGGCPVGLGGRGVGF